MSSPGSPQPKKRPLGVGSAQVYHPFSPRDLRSILHGLGPSAKVAKVEAMPTSTLVPGQAFVAMDDNGIVYSTHDEEMATMKRLIKELGARVTGHDTELLDVKSENMQLKSTVSLLQLEAQARYDLLDIHDILREFVNFLNRHCSVNSNNRSGAYAALLADPEKLMLAIAAETAALQFLKMEADPEVGLGAAARQALKLHMTQATAAARNVVGHMRLASPIVLHSKLDSLHTCASGRMLAPELQVFGDGLLFAICYKRAELLGRVAESKQAQAAVWQQKLEAAAAADAAADAAAVGSNGEATDSPAPTTGASGSGTPGAEAEAPVPSSGAALSEAAGEAAPAGGTATAGGTAGGTEALQALASAPCGQADDVTPADAAALPSESSER